MKMRRKHIYLIWLASLSVIWIVIFRCVFNDDVVSEIFLGIFCGIASSLCVPAYWEIQRRRDNGIDLFATLETDEEKLKAHMLFVMQWGNGGGIKGQFKELKDIFRNYPQWHLTDWEVFRAWYKDKIDFMCEHPDVFVMTMKDGSPYEKEKDALYDPAAPDWAQFDRERYDDEDDNDDDYIDWHPQYDDKDKRYKDAISIGMGFAIGNTIIGGGSN